MEKHSYVFSFLLFTLNMQDIEGKDIQTDLQKCTMGIYVISKEKGDTGHYDDTGIFGVIIGVIILDNIGSAAQAWAVTIGVIHGLNLAYPNLRN